MSENPQRPRFHSNVFSRPHMEKDLCTHGSAIYRSGHARPAGGGSEPDADTCTAARGDDRARFKSNTDDNDSVEVFQLPLRATLSYNSKSLGSCASPLLSIFFVRSTNHANAVTEVAANASRLQSNHCVNAPGLRQGVVQTNGHNGASILLFHQRKCFHRGLEHTMTQS